MLDQEENKMNIADKIGLYLLLSIVFALIGLVVGEILPYTYQTETIIFGLAIISISFLFAAIVDILIWILIRSNQLIDKEYNSRFLELAHVAKLTFYSVLYVTLYPMIEYTYDDGGLIYAKATEIMGELYGVFGNVLSYLNITCIVIVLISALLYYWNEPIVQKK